MSFSSECGAVDGSVLERTRDRLPSMPPRVCPLLGQDRGPRWRRRQRIELEALSNAAIHHARRRKSAKEPEAARQRTGRVAQLRAGRDRCLQHNVRNDARRVAGGNGIRHHFAQGHANLAVLLELRVGLQCIRLPRDTADVRISDRAEPRPRCRLLVHTARRHPGEPSGGRGVLRASRRNAAARARDPGPRGVRFNPRGRCPRRDPARDVAVVRHGHRRRSVSGHGRPE